MLNITIAWCSWCILHYCDYRWRHTHFKMTYLIDFAGGLQHKQLLNIAFFSWTCWSCHPAFSFFPFFLDFFESEFMYFLSFPLYVNELIVNIFFMVDIHYLLLLHAGHWRSARGCHRFISISWHKHRYVFVRPVHWWFFSRPKWCWDWLVWSKSKDGWAASVTKRYFVGYSDS